MIALSTSVLPSPAKSAATPPPSATGDFSDALAGLTDPPATAPAPSSAPAPLLTLVKPTILPALPTGLAKPGLPDVSRLADPETGGAPVSLSAFLDSAQARDPATALPASKGQDVAGDGKTVPAAPGDDDASQDVIWLPSALLPIQLPVSRPPAFPKFGGPPAPVVGEVAPTPLPAGPAPVALAPVAGGETPPVLTTPAQIGPDISIAGDAGPAPQVRPAIAQPDILVVQDGQKVDMPIRAGPTLAASTPITQPQPVVAQPAAQAFAAAIASVVQQARRDDREPGDARTPLTVATTALEALHTNAIAATAEAKHGALDLKQDSGLQGMIDHIEALRDGADANDTRIRLVPDALGAVDVSVRRQGDRLHVHFAAENRNSAQLLSEAQPRLAELAEQRGVKLGQTSVGSGLEGGPDSNRNPARQHQAAIQSFRPVAVTGTDISDPTDSRIG